ncbi:hypothetical protein HF325_003273 [Metschnikowia pulcherrima]|uniref:Uncharacterized protein n=1 Tax=Metschnikowia pulcherrima TaxID=27326 RepID=A0A8H7LC01_9ASCO|nr:hypothetical protein HF325_003273 [Metschnikowia pulcherrima]
MHYATKVPGAALFGLPEGAISLLSLVLFHWRDTPLKIMVAENIKPSENNNSTQDQGNEKEKLAVSAYSDKAKIGKSFEAEWSLLQNQDTDIKYTVQGPTTEYDPDPFFDFPLSISEDNIFLTDLSPPVFSKVSKAEGKPSL